MKVSKAVISNSNNNSMEANSMIKLTIISATSESFFYINKLTTRSLYKLLRENKFLPAESSGKTSCDVSEDGTLMAVSYKDIMLAVEVEFNATQEQEEEVYLVADPAKKAAAFSLSNYGLTSNFGIIASKEIFFMEYDEKEERMKRVGADIHTTDYLAQLDTREKRAAAKLARSKKFHDFAILKNHGINPENLNPELAELIAAQWLDRKAAPNSPLQNDEKEMVKVQVQRYNPESGHWYNAKTKVGLPMVEYFEAEEIFEFDNEGKISGVKMATNGQTAIAHVLENEYDLICVHNIQYIDKTTSELVFKAIDQRFIISGKCVNSSAYINGQNLIATQGHYNFTVNKSGEVVPQFQYFGYESLVDIGEGFFLMPAVEEESKASMDEKAYQEGIMYGTSKSTLAMDVESMAKEHIAAHKKEEEILKKIEEQTRYKAESERDSKADRRKEILASSLYHWAAVMEEDTHNARKNTKLQLELNEKFTAIKDQADELLEVLTVLKEETGKGFAYPSWKFIDLLAKQPKAKSSQAFADKVKKDVRDAIKAINDGEEFSQMHPNLVKEVIKTCQEARRLGLNLQINNKKVYFELLDIASIAQPSAKPRNGAVKNIDVADYYMTKKA